MALDPARGKMIKNTSMCIHILDRKKEKMNNGITYRVHSLSTRKTWLKLQWTTLVSETGWAFHWTWNMGLQRDETRNPPHQGQYRRNRNGVCPLVQQGGLSAPRGLAIVTQRKMHRRKRKNNIDTTTIHTKEIKTVIGMTPAPWPYPAATGDGARVDNEQWWW